MTKCELCGLEWPMDEVSERDDCDGMPHLVCNFCWENLEMESYEPEVTE